MELKIKNLCLFVLVVGSIVLQRGYQVSVDLTGPEILDEYMAKKLV
jgi:hypothetical protein